MHLLLPKFRYKPRNMTNPRNSQRHISFNRLASQTTSKYRKYRPEIIPILTIITAIAAWRGQLSRDREVDNLWARVRWLTNEIQTLKAKLEEALEENEDEAEKETGEDILTYLFQEIS
jgi:hypothetical protein